MKISIRRGFQRSPSGQILGEHWVVRMGETVGEGITLRDAKMDARHNRINQPKEVTHDRAYLPVKA